MIKRTLKNSRRKSQRLSTERCNKKRIKYTPDASNVHLQLVKTLMLIDLGCKQNGILPCFTDCTDGEHD